MPANVLNVHQNFPVIRVSFVEMAQSLVFGNNLAKMHFNGICCIRFHVYISQFDDIRKFEGANLQFVVESKIRLNFNQETGEPI